MGPRPYAYEQVHEESPGTDHAVWYDPFFTQSPAAQREDKRFSPRRAPRNNHTPDLTVFSNWDQPNMFLMTLPGPGGSGEPSRHEGRAPRQHTLLQFPALEKISSLGCSRGLPTPRHATLKTSAVEKQASLQQNVYPESEYSYSSPLFLPELQLHVQNMNSCAPVHPMNFHAESIIIMHAQTMHGPA